MATHTSLKRKTVLEKYDGRCAYCGMQGKKLTLDHVVPKAAGGTGQYKNLLPACHACNNFKSDLSIEEFREKLAKLTDPSASISLEMALKFGQLSVTKTEIVFLFET